MFARVTRYLRRTAYRGTMAAAAGVLVCGACERPAEDANGATEADRPTPGAIEQAVESAEQYIRSDRLDEAETILDRLIDRAPEVLVAREMAAQIHFLRGRRAKQSGDASRAMSHFEAAHDEYQAALSIDEREAGLHHSAAMMAMAAERADAAIGHLETAVQLDSVNPQYPLHLAQLYMQEQRWQDAEAMLDRVLAIDPDEPYAYASLAGVALERGDIGLAVERINQARRLEPDDLGLRVQAARIHRRGGDPARSIELLSSLARSARAERSVADELGQAYRELGEHEKAAEAWTLRFRQNDSDWRAAVKAAEAWIEAGYPERANDLHQLAELEARGHPDLEALDERIRRALRERNGGGQ